MHDRRPLRISGRRPHLLLFSSAGLTMLSFLKNHGLSQDSPAAIHLLVNMDKISHALLAPSISLVFCVGIRYAHALNFRPGVAPEDTGVTCAARH